MIGRAALSAWASAADQLSLPLSTAAAWPLARRNHAVSEVIGDGTLNFAPALLPRPNLPWEQEDAVAKERKDTKKSSTKKRTKTRNGKRELINTGSDKRFVRRSKKGRFKESDDVGRSLATDRRKKAKKKVRSGYGDRGDR